MNTFTLPRDCVLPVPAKVPQQEALPVCASAMPVLVGSMQLMSHCHVWVSVKAFCLICSGCHNSHQWHMHVHKMLKFGFKRYLHHEAQCSLCDKCADLYSIFLCKLHNRSLEKFISASFLQSFHAVNLYFNSAFNKMIVFQFLCVLLCHSLPRTSRSTHPW